MDATELLAECDALLRQGEHSDDGMTRAEWSEKWGTGQQKTLKLIRAALDSGRMIHGTRTETNIIGQRVRVPVYAVKGGE